MTAVPGIDVAGWLEDQLAQASPDLLRSMVQSFAEALMGAEADAVCGAGYGERSTGRTNTRAGSIGLAIPKLRHGSYFPDWLLERRRRAEAALVTVVATSYLLGVSTRRMEKLVETLGVTRLSKSQYAANLMAVTPKSAWGWVRALLHSVYDQPDAASVHAQFGRVLDALAGKLPAVAAHLDAARPDILAFTSFPKAIWRQIWTDNPQERLNREIRRRTDVVGIFPARDALIRLVGAVLAEQHDEWAEMRRYIGLDILAKSRLTLTDPASSEEVTLPAITA